MAARAFRSLPAELTRRAVEEWIERMIALLDMLDGDSNLEPDEDGEPSLGSLGSCGRESMPQTEWARAGRSDRELDAGDEPEIDHEDEDWRQPARTTVTLFK